MSDFIIVLKAKNVAKYLQIKFFGGYTPDPMIGSATPIANFDIP